MTNLYLPSGTCLTLDGLAVTVDAVSLEPRGHWVRPVDAPGNPTEPFVLRGSEVPGKLTDGSLVIGPTTAHAPVVEVAKYEGMHVATARKEGDAALAVGRLKLVEAFEDTSEASRRNGSSASATWSEIAAALELPNGIKIPSTSTVRRHRRIYKRSGRNQASLLPRDRFKGNRDRRKPDFVVDAIETAIDQDYTGKGSVPEVVDTAIGLARSMLPADLSVYTRRRQIIGTDEYETVSMIPRCEDDSIDWARLVTANFVRRSIARRTAIERACMIHGAEDGKEMFAVTGQGPQSRRLLHRAEIDNFRLGLFIVDAVKRLPLGFPWVTVLLDTASRAVIGLHIGFLPPSGETVAQCLKHAVMPKDLSWTGKRPDGTPVLTHGWPMFGRPFLIPCDLGSDFISGQMRDACFRLGMNLLPLIPGAPKLKGKVERFIRTLKHGKVGRVLGLVPALKTLPDDRTMVLTLDELRLILTYWIVEIYHQKRHEALGKSPAQAWEDLAAKMPVIPPPSPKDMQLCVGHWDTRTIDDQGIRINGLKYNSPGLGALRKMLAKDQDEGRLRDVDVKFDDADISVVNAIVEDPERKGNTIAVEAWCTQPDYADGNLTLHQHLVIKEYAKEKAPMGRITVNQLIDARLELNAITDRILGDRKASGGHVKVARYLGVGQKRLTEFNESYDGDASQRLLDLREEEVEETRAPSEGPKLGKPDRESEGQKAEASPGNVGRADDMLMTTEELGTRVLAEANAPRGRRKLGAIDG
ncbi:hypothetical protein [Bosea sp. TAF32]|uniref:hypothetical protein n=1 Tax=Bosea sp. TAF32 TaxID=3237482 RepID=UPI003F914246